MTAAEIAQKLYSVLHDPPPLPGQGQTAQRHARLWSAGVDDLSFARIAEAHWDAVAILAECGREAEAEAIYGVWASESPVYPLRLDKCRDGYTVSGTKMFCSGLGIVDRALVTVGSPEKLLVEVDLHGADDSVKYDQSAWATKALCETNTGSVAFNCCRVAADAVLGGQNWYIDRAGFWHGACGPAACWAGGAEGLVQYAMADKRQDAHTLAHLGAMHANIWAMHSCLDSASRKIDAEPENYDAARIRALTLRHLVEQNCTDILRRFGRAYGPSPLSMNASISQRYHELDLYLRQSHAERDLELLGCCLRNRQDLSPRG
jgi:hypothetical protein